MYSNKAFDIMFITQHYIMFTIFVVFDLASLNFWNNRTYKII